MSSIHLLSQGLQSACTQLMQVTFELVQIVHSAVRTGYVGTATDNHDH